MKKFAMKKNLMGFVMVGAVLLVGVQEAFATCTGMLHFKKPDNWSASFFVGTLNYSNLVPPTALNRETGYYDYDLANTQSAVFEENFSLMSSSTTPMNYVLSSAWNGQTRLDPNHPRNNADIVCPNVNGATDVWVMENPKKPGTTLVSYTEPDIKYLYVLPPDNKDWLSSTPMWSGDGTYESRQPLKVVAEMCGWYYMVWVDEPLPEKITIFRDDDTELNDAISSIRIQDVFDVVGANTVYFVADNSLAKDYGVEQFSATDPGIDGVCSFALAAVIYDTDASMHGAFTCDAYPSVASNGCYYPNAPYGFLGGSTGKVPCIGVTRGIVAADLDPTTKKPTYNSTSGCFVNQEAFDVMFRETPGVNVMHCRDIAFKKYDNGLWGYDSYNEPTGAFTILNNLINDASCTDDCRAAATPRETYGNVMYGPGSMGYSNRENNVSSIAITTLGEVADWSAIEPNTGLPYIDLYPTSDGEFASGSEPDVYDNSTWDLRIESMSNQFFCFESHAKFTYRPGLRFYIRGDDDIWVFVDNKLAIDLGGTHMAAPGSMNLDGFVGASGELVTGQSYDLDFFFCDRRTNMSNMYIKTNMNIVQYAGGSRKLTVTPQEQPSGAERLDICYEKSGGDGSCASVALGNGNQSVVHKCGEEIDLPITYSIKTSKGETPANCESCTDIPLGAIFHGGIDLTNPKVPVISQDKIVALASGDYRLVIEIEGKTANYNFHVEGGEDEETSSSSGKTPASSSSGKAGSSSSKSVKSSSSYADDDFASPSFHIEMTGPFEFKIVMNEDVSDIKKSYAVMDLQGRVLLQGSIDAQETLVPALSKGSYIVKVGLGHRRVNVR